MMKARDLMQFDYIIARNPFDTAEGGGVRDNSTRLAYMMTARKMNQPKEPTPPNKSAITAFKGILFCGIPFRKPGLALVFDNAFYGGLLTIDNQPTVQDPSNFETSGTPKSETNF